MSVTTEFGTLTYVPYLRSSIYLVSLDVHMECRGQGHGTRMLQSLQQDCIRERIHSIHLDSALPLDSTFYAHAGFVQRDATSAPEEWVWHDQLLRP